MTKAFTITYITTQDVQSPVSSFCVKGMRKGVRVDETVYLDISKLTAFTKKNWDVLGFLKEVDRMRQELSTSVYRPLLIELACEQAETVYESFETYRLMLSLTQKKEVKPSKPVTVYDRFGKTHIDRPEHPRINTAF